MKSLFVSLFCLLTANFAFAADESAMSSATQDGLGLMFVLSLGVLCLIIARRKTAQI